MRVRRSSQTVQCKALAEMQCIALADYAGIYRPFRARKCRTMRALKGRYTNRMGWSPILSLCNA